MGFEYDWLVVGDSDGAANSASLAAQWGARVAWIVPPVATWRRRVHSDLALAQLQQQPSGADLPRIWRLAQEQTENLAILRSPATLAQQGVDVILAPGEFDPQPQLQFRLKEQQLTPRVRELRSRRYLLAPSPKPQSSAFNHDLQGIEAIPHHHLNDLKPLFTQPLPQQILIVGSDPQGAVLAQTLARLGCSVQLILSEPQLLPQEDPQLGQLLQAHLDAAGVQVRTATSVSQVREIDGQIWLQAGNQALETEALILAPAWGADLTGIGLDKLPIKWGKNTIKTSPSLETAQPHLYACGSILGGYGDRHLERYEAQLATHNALRFRQRPLDYSTVPRAIATVPPIAAVGLTTPQAQHQFGDGFISLSLPLYQLESSQRRGNLSGFAKLLVSPSGQLLGAHSLGDKAPHWIQSIALLIRQNAPIEALAKIPPPDDDLFAAFLQLWHHHWQTSHPRQANLQQAWFNWRRS
ncbi:FAD-dependent oxidoreductase [Sodalinema gerasimenkoae]|uniref:FAD-dependent oxidoreductase n=1 Tax=Sodalinema gerasimenkoae TaxID=2862348 RepID=UPI0013576964|nr:FAD-dependent oxidoreductase [Sodalinema gerasimenkoae]